MMTTKSDLPAIPNEMIVIIHFWDKSERPSTPPH
jgi:hypothetical protein